MRAPFLTGLSFWYDGKNLDRTAFACGMTDGKWGVNS